jgi:ABC-2 type transport system ATP-binding protein
VNGENVVAVSDLVKTFGKTRALDGLDLSVRSGAVHGFLGPNGAGKSTTLRVLLGLIRKDSGEARLLGGDSWRDAVALHRRLAYMPGDVTLWPGLTGGEVIDLLGRMRGGLDQGHRAELLERFELDPSKKSRTYSKGNRQKVALVAALASDAELLLLDEPTSGLDPLMEAAFRECVEQEKKSGRTVLLSSHILSEVEALCDRVTIIRDGKTVESGPLSELRHLTRTSVATELGREPVGLAELPGVHDLRVDGRRVRWQVESGGLLGLVAAGYAVGAALKLRGEETSGRVEAVLASPVSRSRWVSIHLTFAILGPAVLLGAAGIAAGLAYGQSTGDVGHELPRVLAQAMVQLPAVWVLVGVSAALFGLPRLASSVGWAVLAACVLLEEFGRPLQLSKRVLDLSPFAHVPKLPDDGVFAMPLAWLVLISAVLVAAGLLGVGRRDVL